MTTPEESLAEPELHRYDTLAPYGDDDRSWLREQRDRFMGKNPEIVAIMEAIAHDLIEAQASELGDQPVYALPDAIPVRNGLFVGSASDSPLRGILLTLDAEIKRQTGFAFFGHDTDKIFYETPQFMQGKGTTVWHTTFGVISRTDDREVAAFDPPVAIAISSDCRYAQIVSKVSDEELAQRHEVRAADELTSIAIAEGESRQRQEDLLVQNELRDRMSLGLTDVAKRALVNILSEAGVVYVAADDDRRHWMDRTNYTTLTRVQLLAARSILEKPDAYISYR